jgi:DNA-directed RNA polymerase specialized sigma24 family protein
LGFYDTNGRCEVSNGDSVTLWLDDLRAGNDTTVARLWDRYFQRLVKLAGAKLPSHKRREFDEEDVALSAFQSFCDRVSRDQFAWMSDREDLWRVLATITARKAIDSIRHQTRLRRGGGAVLGESAVIAEDQDGMAALLSEEPTPDDAVRFTEDYERLLAKLGDDTLRRIALRKLEGHTSEEIAIQLGISKRTIDRKLNLIREIWCQEVP